jgi:hypothetical protein
MKARFKRAFAFMEDAAKSLLLGIQLVDSKSDVPRRSKTIDSMSVVRLV